jgi:alpha-glucosidase
MHPLTCAQFYIYPTDSKTFGIDAQFFFGDSILVSPVLAENKTSVQIYVPDDTFYDWNAGFAPVHGNGSMVNLTNVNFTTIPLHVRGGAILPLRIESANTTTQLRTKGFNLVIAPGRDGSANGSLYLDDGLSIEQPSMTFINFTYASGDFSMSGDYSYPANVSIERITVLNVATAPQGINITGVPETNFSYNNASKVVTINTNIPLTQDISIQLP